MSGLDALGAAALARELEAELRGARVQDVLQLDPLSHGLEFYQGRRRWLLLSAAPEACGPALGDEKLRRGAAPPSPLHLALVARLEGARLRAVHWPKWERMLVFDFEAAAPLRLVAELQGRLANLLLLDEDRRILAAARSLDGRHTRVREVRPGLPYQPPPPPAGRTAPDAITAPSLAAWLTEAGGEPAWRVLVARLRGISPLAAKELVYRAAGDGGAPAGRVAAARLLAEIETLIAPLGGAAWEPGGAELPGKEGAGPVRVFAPYRLGHLPDWRPLPTLLAAMAWAAEGGAAAADAYAAARRAVALLLDEARARLERQRQALAREAPAPGQADELRLWADLLLAYQAQVPRGAGRVELPGMEGPVGIPLDAKATAIENAERYYDRARRLERAARELPARLEEADARLATLAQWGLDLDLAAGRPEIDAVQEALRAAGYLGRPVEARPLARQAPSGPLELTSTSGLRLLVGRNSRQNEVVTFQRGARGDLWLHARGRPGAHVLIKCAGRRVDDASLAEAAGLALWFSGARREARGEVICADLKQVSRMKGGGPGMVRVREERSLQAVPVDPGRLAGGR